MCIRDREHTAPEERFADLFPSSKGTVHEAVGVCPRCGAPVYEDVYKRQDRAFLSDGSMSGR